MALMILVVVLIIFLLVVGTSLTATIDVSKISQSAEISSSGLKMNQNVEGNESFVERQGNRFWNFIDSIYWIIFGLGVVWIGVGIVSIFEKIKNLFMKSPTKGNK